MNKLVTLTMVVPCFNEEAMLPISIPRFLTILSDLINKNLIDGESKILFVDDGSTDSTWDVIRKYRCDSDAIQGLRLSRNFGHQNALLAGLMAVKTGAAISIDADLQDDPEVIEKMIMAYIDGADIVYGVRSDRTSDSISKRFFAQKYYKFLSLLGVNIIQDHADFRLMSIRAIDALKDFKEVNLFLRGIIPILGFRHQKVYYARRQRAAGVSKYDIGKMMSLAINGVAAFSVVPLMMIIWLGILLSFISALLGAWALLYKFLIGGTVHGWASIVVPMYFLGGIQLLTLGIIGVYVSKIYLEVKGRPRFIIEEELM